jgi:integrase
MARMRGDGLKWGEGSIKPVETVAGTRYRAVWRDAEGNQHAQRFDTERLARQHLQDEAEKRANGSAKEPEKITVRNLIEQSINRNVTRRSPRTTLTYRHRAETMIYPYLGERRAAEMRTLDVQQWIERLQVKEGKREAYEPSSIHAAVSVIYGAFREAARLGILPSNVVDGIRRPGIGDVTTTTWSETEARRFLAAVRDDGIYGALYHVALATGMRPGELRALQWIDVRLDTGVLHVNRTMTKGIDGKETMSNRTKTSAGRAIAISDALAGILRHHRALQAARQLKADAWHDLGLVFDRGDGKWISQTSWQKAHRAYCEQVEVSVIRAHDLRHTSASLELAAGTHPKIVSERLGHASIEMTLDRYQHVSADLQQAAAEALSARLIAPDQAAENRA